MRYTLVVPPVAALCSMLAFGVCEAQHEASQREAVIADVTSAHGSSTASKRLHANERARDNILDSYRAAQNYLPWNLDKHVHNNDVAHGWIGTTNTLWYKRSSEAGHEFILADPRARTKRRAFDHEQMAAALTRALGKEVSAQRLPIDALLYEPARQLPVVVVDGRSWECNLGTLTCAGRDAPDPGAALAPGGRRSLFVKDRNLWLRDAGASAPRQLTSDGDRDRAYAILPESSTFEITQRRSGKVLPPVGLFSPDGGHYITYRLDQSKVTPLHLLQNVPEDDSIRPVVHEYRYAFPGEVEGQAEFFIFDLRSGKQIRVDHPPVAAVAEGPIGARYLSWSEDGRKVHLLQTDRSFRTLTLSEIDARSGQTRTLRSETETINYLPAHILPDAPLVRVLGNGDFLWPSERSGFLHLYRYDGKTGALKNALTSGSWLVREIVRIDEAAGVVYFTAIGHPEDSNPYFRSLWRVKLDGTGLKRLTPEDADHLIKFRLPSDAVVDMLFGRMSSAVNTSGFSPDGSYFIDSYSTPSRPTVTVVRSVDGKVQLELETAALGSAISNYVAPESFRAMAADGKTPIYGLLLKPSDFDPSRVYPVIDSIYPGPQVTRTPTRFMEDALSAQALAELGFIVVIVDGRGTPLRSKEFRAFAYGNMGAAGGLADHVAAIQQLARTRPWMDVDNVGIYGTSGGGYATVHALFDYPDFYKVGVASAGNHDQRAYLSIWGEAYHGPFDARSYEAIASYRNAANFKGKLLLAHGDMDDNVHPANTLRVADQLIRNNKPFDMLIMPNVDHGILGHPYFMKRLWDYFVVNMKHEQPPLDFVLHPPQEE